MAGADEAVRRLEILRELLGSIAEDAIVRPPFYCDYGYNTHVAAGVFVNFGCVFLDVGRIDIGEGSRLDPMSRF